MYFQLLEKQRPYIHESNTASFRSRTRTAGRSASNVIDVFLNLGFVATITRVFVRQHYYNDERASMTFTHHTEQKMAIGPYRIVLSTVSVRRILFDERLCARMLRSKRKTTLPPSKNLTRHSLIQRGSKSVQPIRNDHVISTTTEHSRHGHFSASGVPKPSLRQPGIE